MSKAFLVILMCGFLGSGCSSEKEQMRKLMRTDPIALQVVSAGEFLKDMRDQGRLPGISKNEHGKIKTDQVSLDSEKELYPISNTFHFTKNGSPFTYHYSVARPTEDESWQLQRAWRTDRDGRILEEWPVK